MFECLIGKKLIEPSFLTGDKDILVFKTENSVITAEAMGDCCSHSWVEHFDSIPMGETIKSVVEKEAWDLEHDMHERLQQYFYEIITDKGSYSVEMRNSSNGYYGGYFNIREESTDRCAL